MTLHVLSRARALALLLAPISLAGCTTIGLHEQRLAPDEALTPIGPAVRDNRTPMEAALACFGDHLASRGGSWPVIAVGDVKDYTGKYSISEGNAITQGGSLMVYSALGKIGRGLRIAERFDPVIAERELGYTDRRQLGDGRAYEVNGNKVPWVPYFGGSITRSDYYIVGGITELNYDVRSQGAEVSINNIGPKARVYTESVGVDLRIVDTRTLAVVRTVSLTKQFTGYEVGANVFRFFGLDLFDINLGAKAQEPLQLGIRTALEEATIRLVGAATNIDPKPCLGLKMTSVPVQTAEELHDRIPGFEAAAGQATVPQGPVPAAPAAPLQSAPMLNQIGGRGAGGSDKLLQIGFEFGDANLNGASQAAIDQLVSLAAKGPVAFMLVARDTENWDPAKRDALIDQRVAAVVTALANRGISTAAIQVSWRPDRADTSIHRDGPGMQEIAKLQILR